MKTLSIDRLNRLSENGFTVIHFKKFALVRKYSKFCNSSFWKRHCPIYVLVRKGKENE